MGSNLDTQPESKSMKLFSLFACLFTFIIFSSNLSGQTAAIDSLENELLKNPNDSAKIHLLRNLASQYTRVNPEKACQLLDQSTQLARSLDELDQVNLNQSLLAQTYSVLGKFDTAVTILHEVLAYHTTAEDRRGMARCYQSLGMTYGMKGDIAKAIEHTKDALHIYQKENLTQFIYPCLNNLLLAYGFQNNLDSSRVYFNEAMRRSDSCLVFNCVFLSHVAMGDVFQHNELIDSATLYFKKAVAYNIDTSNSYSIGEYYRLIGKNFLSKDEPDSSVKYLNKAYEIHLGIHSNTGLLVVTKDIAEVHESNNNFESALFWQRKYSTLKDSIYQEKNVTALQELEVKHNTEKERQKNALLATQGEVQQLQITRRNSFIIILCLAFVLLAVIAVSLIKRIRSRSKTKEITLERQALRSQMNPHFVFNALSCIQHIVYNNDRLFAVKNIAVFAKLMRTVLNQSAEESISLKEELRTLDLYLQLEALRFEDRFAYKFDFPDDLHVDKLMLPPLILQPFIENSIKHGLLNKEPSGGNLVISFRHTDRTLTCSIKDDGVGRKKAAELKSVLDPSNKSFSSESIQRRIDLLNQKNKSKITCSIHDLQHDGKASGTEIVLSFPQT